MDNMDILAGYLPRFLLVLLRAGIFVSLLPFLGSKNFPAQFKIGFVISIALILTPVVEIEITKTPIPILVIREIMLGIILGASVRFVFFAVDMAGQIMSNAMGLSIATVFNPEIGQSTEIARLYGIITMLILLSVNAHHELIYILVKSYDWVPVGQVDVRGLILNFISTGGRIFIVALKISAPVAVSLVTANVLLGFIYKAAPQINIFFMSFPLYIALGLLVMLISIPVFAHVLTGFFGEVRDEMQKILAMAKG